MLRYVTVTLPARRELQHCLNIRIDIKQQQPQAVALFVGISNTVVLAASAFAVVVQSIDTGIGFFTIAPPLSDMDALGDEVRVAKRLHRHVSSTIPVCLAPINFTSEPHDYNPCPRFPRPRHPPPHPTSNLYIMPLCRHTTIKPKTNFSTTLLLLSYNPATHPSPSSLFSKI